MRSTGLLCCVVVLAGVVLISPGRTEENLQFFSADGQDSSRPEAAAGPVRYQAPQEVVELSPAASGVETLREQYLEAARQRASLMDEAALRRAIESEETQVAELRAQQSLQQVQQQLQQITDEYSKTVAGRRAQQLLNHLQSMEDDRDGRFFEETSNGSRFRDDPDNRFNRPSSDDRLVTDEFDSGSRDDSDASRRTIPAPQDTDAPSFNREFNNDF